MLASPIVVALQIAIQSQNASAAASRVPSVTASRSDGNHSSPTKKSIGTPVLHSTRAPDQVLTTTQNGLTLRFMHAHVNENGEGRLPSITVQYFLDIFRGPQKAVVMRTVRVWRARDAQKIGKDVYGLRGSGSSQTRVTSGTVK